MRWTASCSWLRRRPPAAAGASPESGITAYLQLTNAQFVPGSLSPDTAREPTADRGRHSRRRPSLTTNVYPGDPERAAHRRRRAVTSALVGLAERRRILDRPGARSSTSHDRRATSCFTTKLSFSPPTPSGLQTLILRGVDASGQIGPAQTYRPDGSDRARPDRRAGHHARLGHGVGHGPARGGPQRRRSDDADRDLQQEPGRAPAARPGRTAA